MLGDLLLTPTVIYVRRLLKLAEVVQVKVSRQQLCTAEARTHVRPQLQAAPPVVCQHGPLVTDRSPSFYRAASTSLAAASLRTCPE